MKLLLLLMSSSKKERAYDSKQKKQVGVQCFPDHWSKQWSLLAQKNSKTLEENRTTKKKSQTSPDQTLKPFESVLVLSKVGGVGEGLNGVDVEDLKWKPTFLNILKTNSLLSTLDKQKMFF